MGEVLDHTGFLFANPTFLSGLASVMDISGSLITYNVSPSGAEADQRAIASDWANIGSDILNAASTFGEKVQERAAAKSK